MRLLEWLGSGSGSGNDRSVPSRSKCMAIRIFTFSIVQQLEYILHVHAHLSPFQNGGQTKLPSKVLEYMGFHGGNTVLVIQRPKASVSQNLVGVGQMR